MCLRELVVLLAPSAQLPGKQDVSTPAAGDVDGPGDEPGPVKLPADVQEAEQATPDQVSGLQQGRRCGQAPFCAAGRQRLPVSASNCRVLSALPAPYALQPASL